MHHRPADSPGLVVRVHVHLGELEANPPSQCAGRRAAAPGRQVVGDHVVPPLAGRAVKAVGEADERPPVTRRGLAPVPVAPLLTGLDRHHGAEGRMAGVALHDGYPAGQLGGWRGHRQRVDPGERVQFVGELFRTQFPQLRSGAHAGSVREVPACPARARFVGPSRYLRTQIPMSRRTAEFMFE